MWYPLTMSKAVLALAALLLFNASCVVPGPDFSRDFCQTDQDCPAGQKCGAWLGTGKGCASFPPRAECMNENAGTKGCDCGDGQACGKGFVCGEWNGRMQCLPSFDGGGPADGDADPTRDSAGSD